MKIALFNNCAGKGGVAREFYEFARMLSKKGHQLDLFAFSGWDNGYLPVDRFIAKKHIFEIRNFEFSQIKYHVLSSIHNFLKKIIFFYKLRAVSKKLAQKINSGNYDVAFIDQCRFTHAPYVLRYIKIPNVYFCHAPLRNANEPLEEFLKKTGEGKKRKFNPFVFISDTINLLDKKLTGRMDRINAKSAMRILTNSYYTREYIYKAYGIDSKVNYLGVDNEKFRDLGIQKDNFILSVGGVQYIKQFDFIIDSLALITKEKRPKLILTGLRANNTNKEYLKKLADKKKVNLEVKESVGDEELVSLYNQASLVVFVPLMEPFGFIPLEAMACGTPVIGVREAGVRESVKDGQTGILVDRDKKELANAIELLLTDKKLAETLRQGGLDEINKNWTWGKATERLENNLIETIEKFKPND
ncbi:MAG: glycosyltransferase family 4 protein [Candidatus Omnitrophota bacterium]|nr:glycosyltransferase family 4 protein [Candidatus Omnitrophota bacterium]